MPILKTIATTNTNRPFLQDNLTFVNVSVYLQCQNYYINNYATDLNQYRLEDDVLLPN